MNELQVLAVALLTVTAILGTDLVQAKRLGGGGSFGAQRRVAPAAPQAPSATPSAPSAPMQAAPAKAAPTPAASGASRWLGPLAGLAAGLGLAALLSHFGLSEAFGSFLLIALVVVGGLFLVRMLFARRAQSARPLQYAGMGAGAGTGRVEPQMPPAVDRMPPAADKFEPVWGGGAQAQPDAAPATGKFPPGFDPAPFVEQAKLQFRKMQSAYDAADRKALSEVMTPEMLAQVSNELAQRGPHTATEVMQLDAEVLEVSTEGDRHWMSIHFKGLLREDGTVLPKDFDEVWNLAKPVDGSTGWLLAGIQQLNEVA